MAVVNLGQFGNPRASALAGLDESIRGGMAIGNQARNIKTQEVAAKQTSNANEIRAQQLKMELAKAEANVEDNRKKAAYQIWKDASLATANMDTTQKQMFEESDQYKQIQKTIKAYYPEFITDQGKLMYDGNAKFVPKSKQDFLDLKEAGETITAKIKANAPLSSGDLARMVQLYGNMAMNAIDNEQEQEYDALRDMFQKRMNEQVERETREAKPKTNALNEALTAVEGGAPTQGAWWNEME